MRARTGWAVIGAVLLTASLLPALAGCTTRSCANYVDYSDEQTAYDDAALVVAGTVGHPAVGGHELTIDKTYKGDAVQTTIRVGTPADACADGGAQELFHEGDHVIAFLAKRGDSTQPWMTLTPYAGVVPYSATPGFVPAPGANSGD